jgi:hypothetical protein
MRVLPLASGSTASRAVDLPGVFAAGTLFSSRTASNAIMACGYGGVYTDNPIEFGWWS